jgi:hypothetical protein
VIAMSVKENNTRIQITISKELKKQLEEKAKKDNRSTSNYIVKLIQDDV